MNEVQTLAAEARDRAGKGTARAVRRSGRIPGVVYGDRQEPQLISIDRRLILRELQRGGFTSKLFDLQVDGRAIRVLPRDVQLDPVSDWPIHVDFLRIGAESRIRIMIPVIFTDEAEAPGLKRGGVLNVVRHEVEFYCRADTIPEHITISLRGREIGDSIHISEVELPAEASPVISDRDFTIATIAPPTVAAEAAPTEAAEGGEAAKPEAGKS